MVIKNLFMAHLVCLFLLQACAANNQSTQVVAQTPPSKILFVGNSFTYYNDSVHNHFGALLRASDVYESGVTRLRALLISGSALDEHRAGIDGLVKPGSFDAVLMHDHSVGPIKAKSYEVFRAAVLDMSKLVRSRGGEPILWMTWPYAGEPGMTKKLFDAYTTVAEEAGVRMIPVGLAFDRVNKEHPEIDLYSKDVLGFNEAGEVQYKSAVKHPSLSGTYLSACVMYAFLYQQSPVNSLYTAGLDDSTALVLQTIAWELYQSTL